MAVPELGTKQICPTCQAKFYDLGKRPAHCPKCGSEFDPDDAVLTGIESRTSSPVRITRDDRTLQSLNVRGLYPCGEGAGYAGGILSAGVDGIKVAEAVARNLA